MISAEAPILFAKACEMFIVEMTHKAYYYASKNGRKTLQRNDIAAAITDTEIFDFLLDIMPRDEMINSCKDKQLVSGPSLLFHIL
jgi:nuclear transcription factor Y, gamma